MREKRITAVILSVFMVLSLLPSTVFAAAAAAALEGQLKISGTAAVGSTLKADLKDVKPQGLSEDSVSYLWSRKTDGDEEMKELSKEKSYTVVQEDLGARIVLTITGLEDKGITGTLEASTGYVVTAEEAAARDQQGTEASGTDQSGNQVETEEELPVEEAEETSSDDMSDETEETSSDNESEETAAPLEEIPEEEISSEDMEEGVPEDITEEEEYSGESDTQEEPSAGETEENEGTDAAGTEEVDGIPPATEDGTCYVEASDDMPDMLGSANENEVILSEDLSEENGTEAAGNIPAAEEDGIPEGESGSGSENTDGEGQEVSYQAEAVTEDGTGILDFGTVVSGEEEDNEGQYVTVKNTGTGTLNFTPISPEHFVVQDISEPLEPGDSVELWIGPRAGTEPGTYEDTITYASEEGATASFTAKMTVEEKESPSETLKADREALEFTDTEEQTITITNTGTQAVTLKAATVAGTVSVTPSDQVTVEAGSTFTFTVKPAADNLEAGKPYEDTISFSDVSDGSQLLSVSVKTTLPEATATPTPEPEKTSRIEADAAKLEFGTSVEGYAEAPEAKTVTVTNSGNGDAELSWSVNGKEEAQYFDASLADEKISAQGGTTSFTVRPKTGLAAGSYEETFVITDKGTGTEIQITAGFTVEEGTHSLSVTPDTLEFSSTKEGYGEIEAQQFTVTNNGNLAETLTQPSADNFEIGGSGSADLVLQPGESVSFTVRPKTGLAAGDYEESVQIASGQAKTGVTVKFQVIRGTATVTKIQQPAAVTGLTNGTKKDAQSLKLPSTVVIETTAGNMKASVAWDVENCSYDPSSTEAQTFRIRGAVSLPGDVDNNNHLTLLAYIQVSVNAYSPKKASADDNYISGIEYNGVYTTQSRISFTAVGAGMDNTSPRKGDTRYIPLNWTVINTNTWTEASYTGSFGMAKSGDYTLKVVFKLQQYNGSAWTNADGSDTKQVPFRISKAKVTAPGLDLTPAANRRNAVKTGDSTPILPFVIILVAAVVVIGGILVYRNRKNK